MTQTQHFVFLIRRSPFGSSRMAGCFDMLLTAATFDQQVSVIFTGDSVPLLTAQRDSTAIGLKDPLRALSALPLYGVAQIYVEEQAMQAAGTGDGQQQAPELIPLDRTAIRALINDADRVFIC